MEVRLTIRDKSVLMFLRSMLVDVKTNDRHLNAHPDEISAYHLMKDEMFFKKDNGIEIGELLKIELFDRARMSESALINHYTYRAEEYDDLSIKMVLIDFKAENTNLQK